MGHRSFALRAESNSEYTSSALRSVFLVRVRVLKPTMDMKPQIASTTAARKRTVPHHGIWITSVRACALIRPAAYPVRPASNVRQRPGGLTPEASFG